MSFKCGYCDSETHAEVDCSKKKCDRFVELTLGWLFLAVLWPFLFLGALAGAAWGAMRAGFRAFEGTWTETVSALRGSRRPEEEMRERGD